MSHHGNRIASRSVAWLAGVLAIASCLTALADRVTLTDGRTFTGTVTEEPGQVTVETPIGTVSFPRSEVLDVQHIPSPEAQLNARLARLRPDDADGLFRTAQWADKEGLHKQAMNLYRQVVLLDHDHAGARAALGFVRVGQTWLDFDQALDAVRSKMDANPADPSIDAALNELAALPNLGDQQDQVGELRANLLLRRKQFTSARQAYEKLARTAKDPDEITRFSAIAEILADHPDGLYVLTQPYPPDAVLLGEVQTGQALPSGPASLAQPLVLQAALRDRARRYLQAGAKDMDAGRADEPTDMAKAKADYDQADQQFAKADALVADIARSYKIEIVRRRIAMVRRGADDQAARFDAELTTLGKQDLTPQAYANKVVRMMRYLTNIQGDLRSILKLAQPYDRDLTLEIRWAQLDQQRVSAMLDTLRQELNDSH